MKVFCSLIILLFSADLSYASKFLPHSNEQAVKTNKTKSQKDVQNSTIAPEGLRLKNEQNDSDIDRTKNLSAEVQQEQNLDIATQLPSNLINEAQEEGDQEFKQEENNEIIASEVINLQDQKNDQNKELDKKILSNEDLLSKIEQDLKNLNQQPNNAVNQDLKNEDNSLQKPKKYNHIKKDDDVTPDSSSKSNAQEEGNNEENTEEDDDNFLKLPQWDSLFKDDVAIWQYKEIPDSNIYKRVSGNNNKHLPKVVYVQNYYEQVFYCVAKNNVSGLRAIINKLEGIGMTSSDIFALKSSFRR